MRPNKPVSVRVSVPPSLSLYSLPLLKTGVHVFVCPPLLRYTLLYTPTQTKNLVYVCLFVPCVCPPPPKTRCLYVQLSPLPYPPSHIPLLYTPTQAHKPVIVHSLTSLPKTDVCSYVCPRISLLYPYSGKKKQFFLIICPPSKNPVFLCLFLPLTYPPSRVPTPSQKKRYFFHLFLPPHTVIHMLNIQPTFF